MNYESLQAALTELFPEATVSAAGEVMPGAVGVCVQLTAHAAMIYNAKDVSGDPQEDYWLVDTYITGVEAANPFVPDVEDFADLAWAVGHMIEWYHKNL